MAAIDIKTAKSLLRLSSFIDIARLGQIDLHEGLYTLETPRSLECFIGSRGIFDWSIASGLHSTIFPEFMLGASSQLSCVSI
jgi:hypothetical protein